MGNRNASDELGYAVLDELDDAVRSVLGRPHVTVRLTAEHATDGSFLVQAVQVSDGRPVICASTCEPLYVDLSVDEAREAAQFVRSGLVPDATLDDVWDALTYLTWRNDAQRRAA